MLTLNSGVVLTIRRCLGRLWSRLDFLTRPRSCPRCCYPLEFVADDLVAETHEWIERERIFRCGACQHWIRETFVWDYRDGLLP